MPTTISEKSSLQVRKDLLLEFNDVKSKMGMILGEKVNVEQTLHILLHLYKQSWFPAIAKTVIDDMEQCDVQI